MNLERMKQSYNNISFSPERRGEQDFIYYSELLKSDLVELNKAENFKEENSNYEKKFIDKVNLMVSRRMNCASSMITGPANFNVSRNQKRWDSLQKAESDLDHWRKKYFNAVNRVRTLSPEMEIDAAINRIDFLQAYRLNPEGFECKVYDVSTKLRETKKKIEVMKNRIEAKNNFGVKKFKGGEIFIDNDRVIIKHEEKPDREIITQIKKHGFRYSPKFVSWVRKHTRNARYDAENLLNNVFGGVINEA
jgi:hypothetical protein